MDGVDIEEPVGREPSAADADLLLEAVDEWKLADSATSTQRANEVEDLKFEAGKHWRDEDLNWRKKKLKPAFTIDALSGPIAQITNQPIHRIIVAPVGNGADPKTAEYWQGICRRVENLSVAEGIYRWGRQHAIKMGRGFWRVRNDYYTQLSTTNEYGAGAFEQDIRIEPILNQHSVYHDPRCRLLDFSDARFSIITEDLHWSELKRLHPQAAWTSLSQFQGQGNSPPNWATEKFVRIAERYSIVDEVFTLCLLKNGTVVRKDPKAPYAPDQIAKERQVRLPRVKWMKFTAKEVLDRKDVPGRFIPVVQIVGERRIVDGETDYRGLVRMAKEPSRLIDFMESRLAETVDLAAYDTWLTEATTVEQFADDWDNIHADKPARLRWTAKEDVTGKALPPPQRISSSPDISAIAVAAQRATMQLRGVLGMPDVTPDEIRPEQSGKAIKFREDQKAQSTSHYGEGTADGIRHTARIILSMGRELYDVPRILRINGADEKPIEIVTYKGQQQQPHAQGLAQQGVDPQDAKAIRQMLDISVGDFDVTVAAGKGYHSGRQEAVEAVTAMVEAFPPMAPKAIPIILKNSDFPGAQELAKSMEPDDQQTVPPRIQQRLEQLDQIAQLQHDEVKRLQQERDAKTLELASKERIAMEEIKAKKEIAAAQEETKRLVASLQVEQANALATLEGIKAEREQFHQHAHEVGLEGMKAQTAAEEAERAHAQALESGEQTHAQALEQQEHAAAIEPEPTE